MKVYYEKDADLSLLRERKIAVIGYGSQGHAHALNLSESGMDVRVGLREESNSWAKVEKAGLPVMPVRRAVDEADIIMVLAHMVMSKRYSTTGIKSGSFILSNPMGLIIWECTKRGRCSFSAFSNTGRKLSSSKYLPS